MYKLIEYGYRLPKTIIHTFANEIEALKEMHNRNVENDDRIRTARMEHKKYQRVYFMVTN